MRARNLLPSDGGAILSVVWQVYNYLKTPTSAVRQQGSPGTSAGFNFKKNYKPTRF